MSDVTAAKKPRGTDDVPVPPTLRKSLKNRHIQLIALGGAIGTGLQGHFNAGNTGANARVFGNTARVILRHVQVRTNKNPFTGNLALGTQFRKANNSHGQPSIDK